MSGGELERGGATEALWAHRDRRTPAVAAAHALTGLPTPMLEQASRISFAASAEFEAVLAGMDERIRALPSLLVSSSQRCVHEVRGPVLWSETITARANSFGDEDVFVCSAVTRSYDCAENRLLAWLLQRAGLAFKAARSAMGVHLDPGERRRIEETAASARRWRETPRLRGVKPQRPSRLELARLRAPHRGSSGSSELLDAYHRSHQPFSGSDMAELTDLATLDAHAEFLEEALTALGSDFVFSCSGGTLRAGSLSWCHPANTALAAG
ncbi:MAG: hypothetical protein R2714_00240 [Microthrixaceae bacterium]|nr:hypothetical protein [Microthrixaceae bacterium]